ncbi:MAG: PAS domain S-box protein [Rhodocyclaceae bacterium]
MLHVPQGGTEGASADDRLPVSLDALIQALPALVWIKNPDGIYLHCNQRVEALFGLSRAAIVGHTDHELIPVEIADSFRAHDQAVLARAAAQTYEEWVRFSSDGQTSLLQTTKSPLYDTDNRLIGILGMSFDITEHHRAREALRESEQHYRTLADSGSTLIWMSDQHRRCTYFNAPWLRFTGRHLEEELGQGWRDCVHPDDQPVVEARYAEAFIRREPISMEYRLRHASGTYHWVEDHACPRYDSRGEFLGFIGFANDVTEPRRLRTALACLANNFAGLAGVPFFEAVCRHLAESLGVDFAFVGRLTRDRAHVVSLAGWADGKSMEAMHYVLAGTPCEHIVNASACVHPVGVADLYPDDEALRLLGVEAYCGVPLLARDGAPLGLLVLMSRRPIAEPDAAMALLEVFDERVSAEIQRSEMEAALHLSETRFRNLFEHVPNISVQGYDPQRRVIFWNRASEVLYGYSAEEAQGRRLDDLIIPPGMRDMLDAAHREWVQQGVEIPAGELTMLRKDGSPVPVFSSHVMQLSASGELEMYCIDIDLSEQKRAQAGMKLAASVFTHAREGILITDSAGVILDANEAFCASCGYARVELLGQTTRLLKSGRHPEVFYTDMWRKLGNQGHWSGEIWNRRKGGDDYPALLTISAVRNDDAEIVQYVGLYADISAQKAHEAELEYLANHDTLTGLPNRNLLRDRLEQALAQARRRGLLVAVAYIDLDGFKAVNDHHGHETGDRLLQDLAGRMRATLREGDTIARLGGDEFAAVLVDLADRAAFVPFVERLLETVSQPVVLDGATLQVSASIGLTLFPQLDAVDADQLLRQADLAMYQAKLAGKNRFSVFDTDLDRSVRGYHESLARAHRAMRMGEFVLYYQPKVNLRTGAVIGLEALIRWAHPTLGLLAPARFLPDIERSPLSAELGEWVIDSALRQIATWLENGLDLPVSVNISANHLQRPDFVERLGGLLGPYTGVASGRLELEVLETSALDNLDHVVSIIEGCRGLGVGFALDDFGTGYSSLTYLKHLPAGVLKIDQTFVRDMLEDPDDLAILESVLGLANAFRRVVVAEGVETVAHGRRLLQLGCMLGQGYGIARPMPASDVPGWIERWHPDPSWAQARELDKSETLLLYALVEAATWRKQVEAFVLGHSDTPPRIDLAQGALARWLERLPTSGTEPADMATSDISLPAVATPTANELHALLAQACELANGLPDPQDGGETVRDALLTLVRGCADRLADAIERRLETV